MDIPHWWILSPQGGGGVATVEGTYTLVEDLRTVTIVDQRLVGKNIIVAQLYCKGLITDNVVGGIACITGHNKTMIPLSEEELFTYNATALISRLSTTSDYTTGTGSTILIGDDGSILFGGGGARFYKGGYTYNWRVYYLI